MTFPANMSILQILGMINSYYDRSLIQEAREGSNNYFARTIADIIQRVKFQLSRYFN